MNIVTRAKIAQAIIKRILDHSLANSTFREHYPAAYADLLNYREDLEREAMQVLGWKKWRGK